MYTDLNDQFLEFFMPKLGYIAVLAAVSTAIAVGTSASSPAMDLPSTGFVTYSEGDTDQRHLMMRRIEDGQLLEPETITAKGTGGDIMGTISFDGRWLAFARNSAPAGPEAALAGQWRGFENEDYHKFHSWDIYVAPLDGELPATATRVGHGYWPSWGDDSDGEVKSLYFGNYEQGAIMRVSIGPEGTISDSTLHSKVPDWESGDHHMQAAPDGKSVAIRIGNHVWLKGLGDNSVNQRLGSGCHPSWMADSVGGNHQRF